MIQQRATRQHVCFRFRFLAVMRNYNQAVDAVLSRISNSRFHVIPVAKSQDIDDNNLEAIGGV